MISLTLELTTGALTGDTLLVDSAPMGLTVVSIIPKLNGADINPVDISGVSAALFNNASPVHSFLFSRERTEWVGKLLGKEVDFFKALPLTMRVLWRGGLNGESAPVPVAFTGLNFQTPAGKRGRLVIEDDFTITPTPISE